MKGNKVSPPNVLVSTFLIIALVGSLLLTMPWAVKSGNPNFLTALFTSVSALCVTGLVVVDTVTHWSFAGQLVILLLIQVGGLGVMTFATFFVILLKRRIDLKQKIVLQFALNRHSMEGMMGVFRYLLVFSLVIELIGAIILFLHWLPVMGVKKSLWYGLFHSVSAFNNAGFDLFGNFQSLHAFAGDIVVVLTISTLFITGSLGFLVIYEVFNYRRSGHLSLHARLVLSGTGFIIIAGMLLILGLEYTNSLANFTGSEKLLVSFFMSSTRTCGFATIDVGAMMLPTQIVLMGLMFIGGSPGSTAGGIKVTTFILLCMTVWSIFRGKRDVEIAKRRIPSQDVARAMTIAILSIVVIFVSTLLLSLQHHDFARVLFEVVSATGTVGLSMGLTPYLTSLGQIIITITMLFGRLGPITVGLALAHQPMQPNLRYPEDRIMIG